MPGEFEGKIALVTGGSSGIGRAAALAYAREGAKIVVAARREEESMETVRLVEATGGTAAFVRADMASRPDIERMVAETVRLYGRLDIAFNNAGIEGSMRVPAHEYDEAVWDRLIAVNLTGVWLCMKHEIRQMLAQGGGVIVNMSSVSGLIGSQVGVGYGASKFGVVGLTKGAALEYATKNIRVNAVCPAVIVTPMADRMMAKSRRANPDADRAIMAAHPMNRLGTPEEVADAVVWLSSSRASFVTGHALPVDGGLVTP